MPFRDGFMRILRSKWALPVAFFLGLIENSIFIFVMEPLFIPMMASYGKKAWRIALALVLGATVGGVAMYILGAWADDRFIEPLFERIGATKAYAEAEERMAEDGFMSLFLIAVTPFPFQLGTVAAGAARYPILPFHAAVFLGRGCRYFFYALIVTAIGWRAEAWVRKHEFGIFLIGLLIFLGFTLWSVFGG